MSIISTMKSKEGFVSFSSIREDEIVQAEHELNLSFAEDYKEYVKAFGAVSFMGHELTGVCRPNFLNVVVVTRQEKENIDVSKDWYVVEQTHYDDIVFWQSSKGDIYMTKPGTKAKKTYGSLLEYINA